MTKLQAVSSTEISLKRIDTIALVAKRNLELTQSGERIERRLKSKIRTIIREEAFAIKPGSSSVYYTGIDGPAKIVVVAFPAEQSRAAELRDAAYAAARTARQHGSVNLGIAFDPLNDQEVHAITEGALLANYQYARFKSQNEMKPPLESISIFCNSRFKSAVRRAEIFSEAANFVRDLVNEPSNMMNPIRIAEIAAQTAKENQLKVKIYEPAELEKMGANAFLCVGKGSAVPSRMIHVSYEPRGRARRHVALVGKGITFDSGGLSLKTEKGMEHMKYDMAGAATVLASVRAARALALPLKVSGIMMATENMPNSGANRPGDIVRAMNGKTIEITNTDAEGRLALADGLFYAQQLNPDYLFDIATLTGAQIIALGRLIGAVMSNSDALARKIVEAGKQAGEFMWPLPLHPPYRNLIKSDTADVKNSSGIPEGGAIQAGLFLSEFVTHRAWAHLDIAGPAWQDYEWSTYPKNASGFGVRCILQFLLNLSKGRKV